MIGYTFLQQAMREREYKEKGGPLREGAGRGRVRKWGKAEFREGWGPGTMVRGVVSR